MDVGKYDFNGVSDALDEIEGQTKKLITLPEEEMIKPLEILPSENLKSLLPDLAPEPFSKLFDISSIVARDLEHNSFESTDFSEIKNIDVEKDNVEDRKIKKIKEFFTIPKRINVFPVKKEDSFYNAIKEDVKQGFQPNFPIIENPEKIQLKDVEELGEVKESKKIKSGVSEEKFHMELDEFNELKGSNNKRSRIRVSKDIKILGEKFFELDKFRRVSSVVDSIQKNLRGINLTKQIEHEKQFDNQLLEKTFISTEEIGKNLQKISSSLFRKVE